MALHTYRANHAAAPGEPLAFTPCKTCGMTPDGGTHKRSCSKCATKHSDYRGASGHLVLIHGATCLEPHLSR